MVIILFIWFCFRKRSAGPNCPATSAMVAAASEAARNSTAAQHSAAEHHARYIDSADAGTDFPAWRTGFESHQSECSAAAAAVLRAEPATAQAVQAATVAVAEGTGAEESFSTARYVLEICIVICPTKSIQVCHLSSLLDRQESFDHP